MRREGVGLTQIQSIVAEVMARFWPLSVATITSRRILGIQRFTIEHRENDGRQLAMPATEVRQVLATQDGVLDGRIIRPNPSLGLVVQEHNECDGKEQEQRAGADDIGLRGFPVDRTVHDMPSQALR